MTRNTPSEIIAVVQAHLDGKPIRVTPIDGVPCWTPARKPLWDFLYLRYEVEPEPEVIYRVRMFSGYCWHWHNELDATKQARRNCGTVQRFVQDLSYQPTKGDS